MGHRRTKMGNQKILEMNENEVKRHQNLQNAAKAVIRGELTAVSTYIKKEEKISNQYLTLHFKTLEKEKHTKPKVNRRKEIKKIRN